VHSLTRVGAGQNDHPKLKQIEKDLIMRRYKPSYRGEKDSSYSGQTSNMTRVAMVYGAGDKYSHIYNPYLQNSSNAAKRRVLLL
jgi:hypothetical protein